MEQSLVSVIIPAYNVEKYITRCIDSVLSQTYKNIEIIVVDDGSTDGTYSIASQYKNTIKLFSKENGGLCSARNFGLSKVKGKYVVFLDSDDYLDKAFISTLLSYSSGRNDELVMCDFLLNGKKENDSYQFLDINGKEAIFNLFFEGKIYNRTVNKIYPIEILNGLSFPEGRDMLEDAYFTSHVLERCNRIIRIPYPGYCYVRREGSLTMSKHTLRQTLERLSNLLEKDSILTKYVSASNYDRLASASISNIKGCLLNARNLTKFDLFDKIQYLIGFFNSQKLSNKKERNFFKTLSNCKSVFKLKFKFAFYCIVFETFKGKLLFLKSFIKKIVIFKS